MAIKRVLAHFMHEQERDQALQLMPAGNVTDSYVYGEIDDSNIGNLTAQGLIVQVLDDDPKIETPGIDLAPRAGMRMRSRVAAAQPLDIGGPAETIDLSGPNYYLIDLQGPLLEQWKTSFANLNVQLLDHVPRRAYTAHLTSTQAAQVGDLPFVRSVKVYGPSDTAPPSIPRRVAAGPGLEPPTPLTMLTYDVLLHSTAALDGFLLWLEERQVNVAGARGRKARIYLLEGSPIYDEIRTRPEVLELETYVPPTLHNDVARQLLGIDPAPGANPGAGLAQTGDGEVVAVADTGLDEAHPDFAGRIRGIVALGRPGNHSDPHGHGTHVSGSVLGDGTASHHQIKGAAPGAELFFQSLLDSNSGLGGLPLNLADLFQEAYLQDARIHNNSWGSATQSKYTSNSIEVDDFVHEHPDMLIVFSAGNAGQAVDRLNSAQGFTDWLSIDSPASAKNVLTVGASRSARTSGGLSTLTFSQAWPNDFPDNPIGDENVSGNPDGLAAFSSRGPCDDHRIKPDLVAPGTDILSAKSSLAPLRNFWGPFANGKYAYMGGTSMAAPLVSGCAALVREYYNKDRNHSPSAALVKATLINSTRWLTAADAAADPQGVPNFHQGFGCLFMPWAIPDPAGPMVLEFIDGWQDANLKFKQTGQRLRRTVSVRGGDRLRICLAYTDRPARGIQNNLNLFVQHVESGKKWIGNAELPMSLNIPDPDNNVEVVRLEHPVAGDYLIQISATNLLLNAGEAQPFALVVTGELTSPLGPV